MTIRKTGAADGRITQAEVPEEEGIAATASLAGPNSPWAVEDEAALLHENEAADLE
jgi:hypothetical protein